MKIDANSDGTVTWDEFSTFIMTGITAEDDGDVKIIEERYKKNILSSHREGIVRIDYIARERKFITIGREGLICLWTASMQLLKTINTKDFVSRASWVSDAYYMQDHGKLITLTDDRQVCIFDIMTIQPRLLAVLNCLDHNPLCVTYAGKYDEDTELILFGDDGGYVNIFMMNKQFFVDIAIESDSNRFWSPAKLGQKDAMSRYNASLQRVGFF